MNNNFFELVNRVLPPSPTHNADILAKNSPSSNSLYNKLPPSLSLGNIKNKTAQVSSGFVSSFKYGSQKVTDLINANVRRNSSAAAESVEGKGSSGPEKVQEDANIVDRFARVVKPENRRKPVDPQRYIEFQNRVNNCYKFSKILLDGLHISD